MNTLSRLAARLAGIAFVAAAPAAAQAFPVTVASTYNSTLGTVSTTITLGRVGVHAAPSVGAFDFSLDFNGSFMRLDFAQFAQGLGSPDRNAYANVSGALVPRNTGGPGQALTDASLTAQDQARFIELSLLAPNAAACGGCAGPYLEDLQAQDVTLLFLTFRALQPLGSSVTLADLGLRLHDAAVSDGYGNPAGGFPVSYVIPAPSTLALAVLGLLLACLPRPAGRDAPPARADGAAARRVTSWAAP